MNFRAAQPPFSSMPSRFVQLAAPQLSRARVSPSFHGGPRLRARSFHLKIAFENSKLIVENVKAPFPRNTASPCRHYHP